MKRQTHAIIGTALITIFLAGCESGGSSGDDGGGSGNTNTVNISTLNTVNITTLPDANENTNPGMVVTGLNGVRAFNIDAPRLLSFYTFNREDEAAGEGFMSVRMIDYGEGVTMQNYIDFYQPDLDVCEILISDDDGSGNGNGSSGPPRLNIGERVTINSAGAVWVTLDNDGEELPSYETMEGLPGSIPTDATLNVPANDVFPTVNGYPVNKVAPPVRLSPDRSFWVTADSLFSWLPGNNENEVIRIDFNGYDTFTGDYIEDIALCEVIDDGNFELPADLVQLLQSYENSVDAFYYRDAIRLDLVDGVMFRQRNRVGE